MDIETTRESMNSSFGRGRSQHECETIIAELGNQEKPKVQIPILSDDSLLTCSIRAKFCREKKKENWTDKDRPKNSAPKHPLRKQTDPKRPDTVMPAFGQTEFGQN